MIWNDWENKLCLSIVWPLCRARRILHCQATVDHRAIVKNLRTELVLKESHNIWQLVVT
jgi:hypothetical protein